MSSKNGTAFGLMKDNKARDPFEEQKTSISGSLSGAMNIPTPTLRSNNTQYEETRYNNLAGSLVNA
jgi:hypothetical protein